MKTIWIAILVLTSSLNTYALLDPISLTLGVTAASFVGGSFYYFHCKYMECCETKYGWVKLDFTGLENDLEDKLYGQHLVSNTILKALKHHLQNDSPRKSLVMAFNGPTGTGKNLVSSLIAKHMYKEGLKSHYVQQWLGKHHFKHDSRLEEYSASMRMILKEKVKACARALFIIDEMDFIAPGVVDVLKPYLDFHESVDGVDYRKATFIFISNTGAENISSLVFNYKYNKRNREEITMKEIRPLVKNGAFNEKGGLRRADIIAKHLIDLYVPFLPLEREHIISCIEFYLMQKKCEFTKDMTNIIADEMTYFPENYEYFGTNGCKLIETTIVQIYGNKPCLLNKIEL